MAVQTISGTRNINSTADSATYVVGGDEQAPEIAARLLGSAARAEELLAFNGLPPGSTLKPGQTLTLPSAPPPAQVALDGHVKVSGNVIDTVTVDGTVSATKGRNSVNLSGQATVADKDWKAMASLGGAQALGAHASVHEQVTATANSAGDRSLQATTAFKALVGKTAIDTSGTGMTITNNGLDQATFASAVETTLPGAKVGASNSFTYKPDSGVSNDTVLNFKKTVGALDLGAGGELVLKPGQEPTAELKASIGSTLGSTLLGRQVSYNAGGLVRFEDGATKASGSVNVGAGPVGASAKVEASTSAKVYQPAATDLARLAVAKAGGVWGERETTLRSTLGGSVEFAGSPVSLGFRANASHYATAHTLSLHDNLADATRQGQVLTKPTLDDIRAMKPFEQYSDAGERTTGMGGRVSVGYNFDGGSLNAGGDVYYAITGNMARDIEALPGGLVRVRYSMGDSKASVKTLSAHAGIDGQVAGEAANSIKPVIEQVGSAGLQASLEKLKANATTFDVVIDLNTERGASAMQHVLEDDLSEAQFWAGFKDSGVTLNSSVNTSLKAETKELKLNVAGLTGSSKSTVLEAAKSQLTPNEYTFTQAVERTREDRGLFSWDPKQSVAVRFVHQSQAAQTQALPPVGPTEGPLLARMPAAVTQPTLADTKTVVGTRLVIEDKKTSLKDLTTRLNLTMSMMKHIGFAEAELNPFADVQKALAKPANAGADFGGTKVSLETYIGQEGLKGLFTDPKTGAARTKEQYVDAYLAAGSANGAYLSTGAATFNRRAERFATAMARAMALESRSSQSGSPEALYGELNTLFENTMKQDGGDGTAGLAMLALAGPEGISGRAQLELPKNAAQNLGGRSSTRVVTHTGRRSALGSDFSNMADMQQNVADQLKTPTGWPL